MSFTGFSEDDIRKLTDKSMPSEKALQKSPVKKVTFNANNVKNPKIRNSRLENTLNNGGVKSVLPEEAKLTPTPTSTVNNNPKPTNNRLENSNLDSVDVILALPEDAQLTTRLKPGQADLKPEQQQTEPAPTLVVLKEKKVIDINEFEARQKLMEEQNRKRKELLAKALADRTKQTQEEAQRLNGIQVEFRKLDAILSTDVKILRKHIEIASLEYNESQKKYNKIEKEFLEAKLLLHQKLEKKEMLTEHLCTIIEKNEERKADKLNELLQKLQISPEIDGDVKSSNS